MQASLLVELLTEELPPKSLAKLAGNFSANLLAGLGDRHFVDAASTATFYATPRRIAARITQVLDRAADRETEIAGPSVRVGLGADGKPSQALIGFARKNGVTVESLIRAATPKGEVFVARKSIQGAALDDILAGLVEDALKRLPISRMMRWGSGEAQFVRPVHGLVMLHGNRVVPGQVLGLASGNRTRGHRFMGQGEIELAQADEYEHKLEHCGRVIPDFDKRRSLIESRLQAEAARQQARLGTHEALLDEVTALVEHPSVYVGGFDAAFLEVPQECLILTMQQNQKYFPLFDAQAKLLPRFLIVSNMELADPGNVVQGNQRVVRPRLEDARFFFRQDKKIRLEARVPQLAKVIYHNKLGSQLERVERIQLLAGRIAQALGADKLLAERAAWLCKADLLTGMVGEFPELQGIMGRYYAQHDGEPAEVADAIDQHYRPRFAGDALPGSPVSMTLALAGKIEALIGLFGIGESPTGEKDPFGLRRQALGIVRILIEGPVRLELPALLTEARRLFGENLGSRTADADVFHFILDRLKGYLRDRGYAADEIEATISTRPADLDRVILVLEAKRAVPELTDLAAANKRIRNILKKADGAAIEIDRSLLREPAEIALYEALRELAPKVGTAAQAQDFKEMFRQLAGIRPNVDTFFDTVMVNADDPGIRRNRLALLSQLDELMNGLLDISMLTPGAAQAQCA